MVAKIFTKIKIARRTVLGRYRYFLLKISNSSFNVGKGFFCAKGCRISTGREVSIGDDFYMGYNCHLGANIKIGNDVLFASNVAIVGGDHKFDNIDVAIRYSGRDNFKMTVFGDGCWVGYGAIILHGVKIGRGAVVAAGSVVTKDVDPEAIIAGNPAKFIRYRKH